MTGTVREALEAAGLNQVEVTMVIPNIWSTMGESDIRTLNNKTLLKAVQRICSLAPTGVWDPQTKACLTAKYGERWWELSWIQVLMSARGHALGPKRVTMQGL